MGLLSMEKRSLDSARPSLVSEPLAPTLSAPETSGFYDEGRPRPSKWLIALGKSSRESKTASTSIGFPAGPDGDVNSSLGNGALRIRRIEKALFEHPARAASIVEPFGDDMLAPTLLSSARSLPVSRFTPLPMPEHPFARHARSSSAGAEPVGVLRTTPLTIAASGLKPRRLSAIESSAGDSPTDPTYRLPRARKERSLPTPPESASTYPSTDDGPSDDASPVGRSVSDRSDPFALGNLVPPSSPGVITPTPPVSPVKLAPVKPVDAFRAVVLRSVRPASGLAAAPDRLVTLNVGGRPFTTALGTILAHPSHLATFVRSVVEPSAGKPDVPEVVLPSDVSDDPTTTDDLTAAFELTPELGDSGNGQPILFRAARSSGTPSLSSSASDRSNAISCSTCARMGALEIFIDRDEVAYPAVLRWLRSGRAPPAGLCAREAVREEAAWLGLEALAQACAPSVVVGNAPLRPGWI